MHPCEHTLHYCHRSYGRSRASLSSRPPTDRAALPASKPHRRVVEAHWPQKPVTRHTLLVIFFSLTRLSSYPSLSSVAISPMPVCVCVSVCVCVCVCVCAACVRPYQRVGHFLHAEVLSVELDLIASLSNHTSTEVKAIYSPIHPCIHRHLSVYLSIH